MKFYDIKRKIIMAAAVMTCALTAAFSAHAETLSESAEALISGEVKNDDDAQAEDIILSLDNETVEEGEGRDSGVRMKKVRRPKKHQEL